MHSYQVHEFEIHLAISPFKSLFFLYCLNNLRLSSLVVVYQPDSYNVLTKKTGKTDS